MYLVPLHLTLITYQKTAINYGRGLTMNEYKWVWGLSTSQGASDIHKLRLNLIGSVLAPHLNFFVSEDNEHTEDELILCFDEHLLKTPRIDRLLGVFNTPHRVGDLLHSLLYNTANTQNSTWFVIRYCKAGQSQEHAWKLETFEETKNQKGLSQSCLDLISEMELSRLNRTTILKCKPVAVRSNELNAEHFASYAAPESICGLKLDFLLWQTELATRPKEFYNWVEYLEALNTVECYSTPAQIGTE